MASLTIETISRLKNLEYTSSSSSDSKPNLDPDYVSEDVVAIKARLASSSSFYDSDSLSRSSHATMRLLLYLLLKLLDFELFFLDLSFGISGQSAMK